ncbi:unnamed protein product, partial [Amoebophrya sp. A25]
TTSKDHKKRDSRGRSPASTKGNLQDQRPRTFELEDKRQSDKTKPTRTRSRDVDYRTGSPPSKNTSDAEGKTRDASNSSGTVAQHGQGPARGGRYGGRSLLETVQDNLSKFNTNKPASLTTSYNNQHNEDASSSSSSYNTRGGDGGSAHPPATGANSVAVPRMGSMQVTSSTTSSTSSRSRGAGGPGPGQAPSTS